jgi:hypothetical protein
MKMKYFHAPQWNCPNCGLLLSDEQYAEIRNAPKCPECGHHTIMFDQVNETAFVQTGKSQTVFDYLQKQLVIPCNVERRWKCKRP